MRQKITELNVGMPSLKSFCKARRERNTRALYKLAGNYHKAQQRFNLAKAKEANYAKQGKGI